jgi:hypothetical protein
MLYLPSLPDFKLSMQLKVLFFGGSNANNGRGVMTHDATLLLASSVSYAVPSLGIRDQLPSSVSQLLCLVAYI